MAFVTDSNRPPTALATSSNRLSNGCWGRLRGPFSSNASLRLGAGSGYGPHGLWLPTPQLRCCFHGVHRVHTGSQPGLPNPAATGGGAGGQALGGPRRLPKAADHRERQALVGAPMAAFGASLTPTVAPRPCDVVRDGGRSHWENRTVHRVERARRTTGTAVQRCPPGRRALAHSPRVPMPLHRPIAVPCGGQNCDDFI